MIWQLLKRNFAWKAFTPIAVLMFAIFAAVGAFLPPPENHPTREALRQALALSFGPGMVWMLFLALAMQSQWTSLQVSLPIDGRDIWLSQLLALLAMIWLPAMTACAGGLAPTPVFVAAAIFTTFVLAAQCLRIRQGAVPRWLISAGFLIAMLLTTGLPFVLRQLESINLPALPGSVLAVCAFASVALFWWGWTHVPAAYQFAPAAASESRPPLRLETRSPIFVSAYRGVWMQPLLAMGLLVFEQFGFAALYAGFLPLISAQCRWLLPLPYAPRKLFAWIAMPATAAVIIGSLASMLLMDHRFFVIYHPLSANARFVQIAAELALVYFVMFLTQLPAWRVCSQLPPWVRWTPFALAAMTSPFALNGVAIFQKLAAALPETWWQLAPVLALPVIATYGLAQRAFVEREYRALYSETINLAKTAN